MNTSYKNTTPGRLGIQKDRLVELGMIFSNIIDGDTTSDMLFALNGLGSLTEIERLWLAYAIGALEQLTELYVMWTHDGESYN